VGKNHWEQVNLEVAANKRKKDKKRKVHVEVSLKGRRGKETLQWVPKTREGYLRNLRGRKEREKRTPRRKGESLSRPFQGKKKMDREEKKNQGRKERIRWRAEKKIDPNR